MKRIAVLGAGIMGAGIARAAAQAGFEVILRDLQMSLVQDGMKSIENSLNRMIAQGLMAADQKDALLSRIHGTIDLAELQDVDLVIEAVVENMAVKKQLFAELDIICREDTILATNTSSLSISEIASATQRRDRVLGMHFFNPVGKMKLVELTRGIETSKKTINTASDFVKQLDKQYVVINRESPGFIVNRILIPYINEAIFIYGEGLATPKDIDTAMKLGAGMPQGPLELADMMGLDNLLSILLVFYHEFRDPKYRPHPILSILVRAGYYGKKSGRGFYHYDQEVL